MRTVCVTLLGAIFFSLPATPADAQSFEALGSRAQGMGAFVAVADDASAVYWNPAGLASGAYFSLVFDRTEAETGGVEGRAGGRSSWLLALTMPAAGLSYYRLRSTFVSPVAGPVLGPRPNRVESLVTHHGGVTLVQSVIERLAVGATLKLVRGLASEGQSAVPAAELLDEWDLIGVATNRFDVDVGVMATGNFVRAGVTFRNLTRPGFRSPLETTLHLERQTRAGVSLLLTSQWTAAADLDLTRNRGPFGDVRAFALGTEGRLTRRAMIRGGMHVNTAGDDRMPGVNVGGSYAVFGALLVDAHFSAGSDKEFGGWGVAGRVVF
jgi:hypothetical protein